MSTEQFNSGDPFEGVCNSNPEPEGRKFKRIIALSDLHCGHLAGLTHPDWWYSFESNNDSVKAVYAQQQQMWNWYAETVQKYKPIDYLFALGDLVDGKGTRSGGTELRTSDGNEQAEMAVKALEIIEAKKTMITYGTPYHTGQDQDQEDVVASLLPGHVEISGHAFVAVNGLIFDLKHFINGSSIPHGRWTPLAKSKLWNIVWNSEHELQPNSDIILRGHVHYSIEMADSDQWRAMTLPALMGYGSKYGVRKCSGTVHIGFMIFDVYENGAYICKPEFLRLELHRITPLEW